MNWLAKAILGVHGLLVRKRDTRPRIAMTQALYVSETVNDVMREAAENETSPGKALFLRLPDDAANVLVNKAIDPYRLYLKRETLVHWLQRHVLFNTDGEIVVLHDNGKILWTAPNTNLKGMFDG